MKGFDLLEELNLQAVETNLDVKDGWKVANADNGIPSGLSMADADLLASVLV